MLDIYTLKNHGGTRSFMNRPARKRQPHCLRSGEAINEANANMANPDQKADQAGAPRDFLTTKKANKTERAPAAAIVLPPSMAAFYFFIIASFAISFSNAFVFTVSSLISSRKMAASSKSSAFAASRISRCFSAISF